MADTQRPVHKLTIADAPVNSELYTILDESTDRLVPVTTSTGGLTKREMFAAMAQQAIITDGDPDLATLAERKKTPYEQAVAMQAVLHADALIEALNK